MESHVDPDERQEIPGRARENSNRTGRFQWDLILLDSRIPTMLSLFPFSVLYPSFRKSES